MLTCSRIVLMLSPFWNRCEHKAGLVRARAYIKIRNKKRERVLFFAWNKLKTVRVLNSSFVVWFG